MDVLARWAGVVSLGSCLATAAGCASDIDRVNLSGEECAALSRSGDDATVSRVSITRGDLAFRVGCNGEFWLAVVDPRLRNGPGSSVPMTRSFSGSILPAPYPEARYSWSLTRGEERLLDARGRYIRLDRVTE